MAPRRLWTREEFILTLNLYLKIPFGKMSSTNPDIQKLADLVGRTSGSVAIRLTNFAACDPALQARGIKGMQAGAKQCQPYWDEFMQDKEKLVFESERILAAYQHSSIEEKFKSKLQDLDDLTGEDRIREVKTRVNQDVFRQMVISNYNGTCAVSGINLDTLLVASHIKPWAECKEERLNPENGICLSSLYDRAFDQGLITFDKDNYKMILSSELSAHKDEEYFTRFFLPYEGKELCVSNVDYPPCKEFLEWHGDVIFKH